MTNTPWLKRIFDKTLFALAAFCIPLSLVIPYVGECVAEQKVTAENCSGSLYKAKKEGVAVYARPKKSSEVVQRLKLGERVCYLGEKEDFAIVDFASANQAKEAPYLDEEGRALEVAYVRSVDLWFVQSMQSPKDENLAATQPADAGKYGVPGIINKARAYYDLMRHGGFNENPLDAYEPITGIFSSGTRQGNQNRETPQAENSKEAKEDKSAACGPSSELNVSEPCQLPEE